MDNLYPLVMLLLKNQKTLMGIISEANPAYQGELADMWEKTELLTETLEKEYGASSEMVIDSYLEIARKLRSISGG